MLRRLLITFGLLIAFLPYLGFPHTWQSVISTVVGFAIVATLLLSRRKKAPRLSDDEQSTEEGKSLHVERMEIEERPEVHVERETIIDTAETQETPDTATTIEQKVTVVRRRRKKTVADSGITPTTLDVPEIPSALH
jgi:type III secretory pathway component EscV